MHSLNTDYSYLYFFILLPLLFFTGLKTIHGQILNDQQVKLIKKEAVPIKDNSTSAKNKWAFIRKHLKNKKLVLLGEFNHGSKEVFQLKNDLIKYLHEDLDYEVVLLESGIGELIISNKDKSEISAKSMTYGLIGPWRIQSFLEMMQWVKKENIEIAGFDVQRSGGSFKKVLTRLGNQLEWRADEMTLLESEYTKLSRRLRKENYEVLKPATDSLVSKYQSLLERLEQIYEHSNDKILAFSKRTIKNRIEFLQYYLRFTKNKDYRERWIARDSMMADNISWLIRNFYADKRVIVLAHNFHIARYNVKETVMGEFLAKEFGDQMYSVGIFAGAGDYANNSRKKQALKKPDSEHLDIKHVIQNLEGKFHFFPISKRNKKRNPWLNEEIIINDTFINLNSGNQLILAKHFDGLLFVDRISMPNFDY